MNCRKCQRELQDHSAYCPYCGTEQSKKTLNTLKWIISLILVVCLLAELALCIVLNGYCLKHEWVEADCETPKTCTVCGETEGEALGHMPGEASESFDIVNAEIIYKKYCTACNAELSEEHERLNSLVKDEMFIFSPKELLERLERVAKEQFPDFQYEVADKDGNLFAYLVFNKTDTLTYMITLHNLDAHVISSDFLDRKGVWGVTISAMEAGSVENIDPFWEYIGADILNVFCRTCDLDITEKELGYMSAMKLTTLLNYLDFSESVGYFECSGHDYEFSYAMFQADDDTITSLQSVCIYPTDSLF